MGGTEERQPSVQSPGPGAAPVSPEEAQADERQLVRDVSRGDGGAFHRLVDRHGPGLYRLALSLCGNAADAEDVVQETLTGAYRGIGRFEGRSSLRTWLSRILMTQVALWRRRRRGRRDAPLVLDASAPTETDPPPARAEGGAAAVDAKVDLHAALEALSPEHREVIVLRELQGLTYEEIAKVLDVPRGTVESRLHRARAELRDRLRSYLP